MPEKERNSPSPERKEIDGIIRCISALVTKAELRFNYCVQSEDKLKTDLSPEYRKY